MITTFHKFRQLTAYFLLAVSVISGTGFSNPNERTAKRDAVLKNIVPPAPPVDSVVITAFGAACDSVTNCKSAFDKALSLSKSKKGLKIIVPPGIYFIQGPIHLASNVCIELQKGARLKFS